MTSKSGWQDISTVETALLAVVDAVRDYLPPDGIAAEDFISRVIGATDNPEINPTIRRLEGADPPMATEHEAEAAIQHLYLAIEAARNSNQAGENAVVRAAQSIGWRA